MAIKQIVSPRLETANHDKRLTDLSIIGVPESQHGRMPGVAGFPRKFSLESQKVWTVMVNDAAFKQRCKSYVSLDLAWHNAIQEFLTRCEDAGVFPFVNNTDVTKNEFIQDFVRRGRIALVKYLDEVGMFNRVKVKKAYREYLRKDSGLVITSWAELYPVKDPDFLTWLVKAPLPRFHRLGDNKYSRVVQPNVHVWVRYINASRVTLGFSIEVAGTITVPNKPKPTRKEVDAYIDNTLFLPTVRAHRFACVKNRLF